MPRKFTNEPPELATPFPPERNSEAIEIESDMLDNRQPVSAPRALMRRRLPFALWIIMALLLGGLIALVLFRVISS